MGQLAEVSLRTTRNTRVSSRGALKTLGVYRPLGQFAQALLDAPTPIVMEVKRRDSRGLDLLAGRSIPEIVADYEAAGAPCISVVTGDWFGGTSAMLSEVARCTDRPLLLKDFVTRRSQLVQAKEAGASAVLLTLSILPSQVAGGLIDRCLALGLTPFVEVTSEEEVRQVHRVEECVVAVNNKEIRQRERGAPRLDRSVELLPFVRQRGCRCPVSASGIGSPEDAAALLGAGYAGLLMGTALLGSSSPLDFADRVQSHRGLRNDRIAGLLSSRPDRPRLVSLPSARPSVTEVVYDQGSVFDQRSAS
jgi:indole-3-glycerol phosphate synthase